MDATITFSSKLTDSLFSTINLSIRDSTDVTEVWDVLFGVTQSYIIYMIFDSQMLLALSL